MKTYPKSAKLGGAIAAALGCSLIFLCGCAGGKSSSGATLSGKVTYKGEPLTGGTITVRSADGDKQLPGIISPDGTYIISGASPGEMTVMIETESIKGKTGVSYKAPPGQTAPDMGVKLEKYVKIPKSYGDPNTTPFRVTLKKGSQKKDFDLNESGQ
ncbi:MAG TPA: carboxypeptidase-like regulatory domain-containing protein [Gemmataceae bacterium]|jgi:hypothetical protein